MRRITDAGWIQLLLVSLAACDMAGSNQPKPAEEQIAEAALAAPETLRAHAAVLGYSSDGGFATLREGSSASSLICLADDPRRERFHVACYDPSLEPYMSRGRELRASGMESGDAIRQRQDEARAGELRMPSHPAALYNLFAPTPPGSPADQPDETARLFVIYISGATAEDLGLPAEPDGDGPWVMFSGEPNAHVMISR